MRDNVRHASGLNGQLEADAGPPANWKPEEVLSITCAWLKITCLVVSLHQWREVTKRADFSRHLDILIFIFQLTFCAIFASTDTWTLDDKDPPVFIDRNGTKARLGLTRLRDANPA